MTTTVTEGWCRPEDTFKEHFVREGDSYSVCGQVPLTGTEVKFADPPEDPWSYCRTCRSRQ